jgi:NADP-dependent 3-hydroxy acid dehydrogenase YdfG
LSHSRAFAATHSLALLARKRATLESTLASLPQGTNAKAIEADASNADSIISAFKTVKDTWPHAEIDVAVFNPGGIFKPGPFLDADIADLRANLESGV